MCPSSKISLRYYSATLASGLVCVLLIDYLFIAVQALMADTLSTSDFPFIGEEPREGYGSAAPASTAKSLKSTTRKKKQDEEKGESKANTPIP